jgi:hypothetical protein
MKPASATTRSLHSTAPDVNYLDSYALSSLPNMKGQLASYTVLDGTTSVYHCIGLVFTVILQILCRGGCSATGVWDGFGVANCLVVRANPHGISQDSVSLTHHWTTRGSSGSHWSWQIKGSPCLAAG